MTEPFHLEGFDTALRGRRILLIGVEGALRRFTALEAESLYRGKNVLIIGERTEPVPLAVWRRRWDVVFRIRDAFDAQMIATYVANSAKPVRVFWLSGAGNQEVPRGLWSRWTKQDTSLVGCCDPGSGSLVCEWAAIFFSHGCEQSVVERILVQRGVGAGLAQVRTHLAELASSGAALVWSNIDETDVRGSMYWHDPESLAAMSGSVNRAEVGQMLDVIGAWVRTS